MKSFINIDTKFYWISEIINILVGLLISLILYFTISSAFIYMFLIGTFIGLICSISFFIPSFGKIKETVLYILTIIFRIGLIIGAFILGIYILNICKYSILYILVIVFEILYNYIIIIFATVRRKEN